MIHDQQPAVSLFSTGMIGLGGLSILYRDFAYSWQPVPVFHPGRDLLAITCGLFMIAASVALLFRSTAAIAARAIFPFLLAWLCLKVPAVIAAHASKVSGLDSVKSACCLPVDGYYLRAYLACSNLFSSAN